MVAKGAYDKTYIAACEKKMQGLLDAYTGVAGTASHKALDVFEPVFFNHLVLLLDGYFVDRQRTIEGRDGNPLNEVRLLAEGILGDGRFPESKTIKWNPDSSVLGLHVGDKIGIDQAGIRRLSSAYFKEMKKRFA